MLLELMDAWRLIPRQRRWELVVERALAGDTHQSVREYVRDICDRLGKAHGLHRVVLGVAARDPVVRDRYWEVQDQLIDWMRGLIVLGKRRGLVRDELDPNAGAFLVHHVIELIAAQVSLQQNASTNVDRELILDGLTEMVHGFLFGWVPPPRERGS